MLNIHNVNYADFFFSIFNSSPGCFFLTKSYKIVWPLVALKTLSEVGQNLAGHGGEPISKPRFSCQAHFERSHESRIFNDLRAFTHSGDRKTAFATACGFAGCSPYMV
jgi:hypothetical protein